MKGITEHIYEKLQRSKTTSPFLDSLRPTSKLTMTYEEFAGALLNYQEKNKVENFSFIDNDIFLLGECPGEQEKINNNTGGVYYPETKYVGIHAEHDNNSTRSIPIYIDYSISKDDVDLYNNDPYNKKRNSYIEEKMSFVARNMKELAKYIANGDTRKGYALIEYIYREYLQK